MENTGKILFGQDTTPRWFVAVGEQSVGPMTSAEVYDKVRTGQISWVSFVWADGQAQWTRLCDTPVFQVAIPKAPQTKPSDPTTHVNAKKAPPPPQPEQRPWFLYYNDTQFGPFGAAEVDRYLRVGKLHGRVHAWKDGMDGWERLETLTDFREGVAASARARSTQPKIEKGTAAREFDLAPAEAGPGDKREAPRFPMVARLLVANQATVTVAICRDISVGGMQVLTDKIPGPVGTHLKLNVSPAAGIPLKGKKAPKASIEPFVAEGDIVRILEDGRGYSFRFKKLPEKSRKTIEKYIRDSQKESEVELE